ncbi:TIM-barrel domain-containing protein [Limosilactobacillus secaliphilus]|uniref:Alpha-glucosidase n=1 Tax=Limosilactobacillus secaliphilus TaxID=396268 RepID=A0A0R2I230_9LACO|nr:TIM-barrel domain-containing protein [Limosilactobacillus secaliphilus]KRN59305.1 alpha-glucosidase [Limosilactobacillus secaliphilus]
MIIKKAESIEKSANGYLINADCGKMMLVFMTPSIVRLRVSFTGNFPEASYALIKTAWKDDLDELFKDERERIQPLNVDCQESDTEYTFNAGAIIVHIKKEPFQVIITDLNGNLLMKDLQHRSYEQDHLGRLYHYLTADKAHEHYYGFGEETGPLDKKGKRMRLSGKDAIGHDPVNGNPMYKHIPFYITFNDQTKLASGLFYNNSYESLFDMGKEISGYWDPYNYYETDGGDIDMFFLAGPAIKQVVNEYTWLTGTQILPPKQALGFTMSTMYYAELPKDNDKEIYAILKKYKEEDINIDSFWLASGYSTSEENGLRYTFNWNHVKFPHPKEFMDNMNKKGIEVICNLKPGVLNQHPYMKDYEDAGAFIKTADGKEDYIGRWWGGKGRFPDFTNPKARQVWKRLLENNILKKGTYTVWNDNCEYDGVEDRNAKCVKEGLGGRMAELKPIQANMMAKLGINAVKDVYGKKQRPYIINRAGYAGIQRYAQTWAGDNLTDWRTPQYEVNTILGMGLSGVANQGCDIGGFTGGAPEGELLLRWIQNGIFQPRFVMNSANTDNSVTQPWMYDEYNQYVRNAYHLRYRLLPYLYSEMYHAHVTGEPIMRPLIYEFQDDENCVDNQYFEFMFGPSLLVANVFDKGAKTRKVYLPRGAKWFDVNDHLKEYAGGQTIEIPVGLNSIPMFLRDNGIVISTKDVSHISSDTMHNVDFLIGDNPKCQYTYYDDDGKTLDYQNGEYKKVQITVNGNEVKKIHFHTEGSYQDQVKTFSMKAINKQKGALYVAIDGQKIKRFLVKSQWAAADQGWYYDLSDRTILVKGQLPAKDDFDVIVSTEQFDLIGMNQD